MEKKFDLKKFLSNNAIIILIILLALFVGCTTQNFFTETNGKNLLLNVAPRSSSPAAFRDADYQGH